MKPLVIDYDDPEYQGEGERIGSLEYEDLLKEGDENYVRAAPGDEWDAISLNYTSGTTGDPKGVVYHHRGAALLAVGNVTLLLANAVRSVSCRSTIRLRLSSSRSTRKGPSSRSTTGTL